MRLVPSPPAWYCGFWIAMLGGLYVVIKYAIIAAALWLRRHP